MEAEKMQLFLKVYIFTVSLNVGGQFHFQSLLGSVFVLKVTMQFLMEVLQKS